MRKGIAVSPGVAIGVAYCIREIFVDPDTKRLEESEVTAELDRYEWACRRTIDDLQALQRKVGHQIGPSGAAIFRTHETILGDPAFTKRIRNWIVQQRMTAPAALHELLNHYTSMFTRTKDEYLRERLADVRDVVVRLGGHLSSHVHRPPPQTAGATIVVADQLLPSQVMGLSDFQIKGIVTQTGSQTSHAAIIARSRGIPAVSGLRGILKKVKTGDTVVVDGREGHVWINPKPETLSLYRKLEREFFDLKDHLAENRDRPAVSADGEPVELLANTNGFDDARAAAAMGACGVGLYRTEYFYLKHPTALDEEEQLEHYREMIRSAPNHRMTIRTLDIGGDKTIPYLGQNYHEANPFMGWRSIRLSFEHPEFFMAQIRAVLRAAGQTRDEGSQVRLMFPMISTLEEIRRVRNAVRRACSQLSRRKQEFAPVPIGIMVEVPAVAVSIVDWIDTVDFVSIGSNDLVQYLMAADRDNPKVSHLCQPLNPPVLRILSDVIRCCNDAGKPVTLCGEMAAQPRAFALLFGMGLRSFSISPAFIPTIKELVLHLSAKQTQRWLRHAMTLKTTAHVKQYMAEKIKQVAPDIALFETI